MQAPEVVYADILRTLYKNKMIGSELFHRKNDELQVMLWNRERKEKEC